MCYTGIELHWAQGVLIERSSFEKYCTEWKLTANISKTKIVVFSGGRLPKNLKFFFKGSELEIVKEYKYLGVFLGRSGSFTRAKKTYS